MGHARADDTEGRDQLTDLASELAGERDVGGGEGGAGGDIEAHFGILDEGITSVLAGGKCLEAAAGGAVNDEGVADPFGEIVGDAGLVLTAWCRGVTGEAEEFEFVFGFVGAFGELADGFGEVFEVGPGAVEFREVGGELGELVRS
jgi:hypothetical protein